VRVEFEERQRAELELLPSRDRKRAETEWGNGPKRARRRVETGALELALDLVETWLLDLAALAFGAVDLIRNCDRLGELWPTQRLVVAPMRAPCAARSTWLRTRARSALALGLWRA